ncbi:AAA family ATPase [Bradyrhizobium sp. RT5a]|uniref:AAA family ATPase n=1 Tax=unclassified Bradyrhizobium TaxID=2631580 RepID=UPI003398FE25
MKPLDEQIADIEKLDELRQRARGLQEGAIEALTQKTYVPQPRSQSKLEKAAWIEKAERANWALPGDDVEKAEMLQALALLKPTEEKNNTCWNESRERLIADLTDITYKDCIESEAALDTVPIFRCAQVLQALARTPGHALSEAALACFYRVVQELNEIASPAWASAAARASHDAMPTAFITGECVRALLALENALLQTATAAETLGKEAMRASKFGSDFELWRDQEEAFRARSLRVSLATLRPQMIIDLGEEDLSEGKAKVALDKIEQTLRAASVKLLQFPHATFPDLPNERRPEVAKPEHRLQEIVPYYFAGAAKVIALYALQRLVHTVCAPINNTDPELLGTGISEKLKNGAQIVRDLLQPAEQFGEAVIDRELAAHSAALGAGVDGAELAFAAPLLGLVSGNWKRPKVRAAYEVLRPLLSVHGRLRSIRPFNVHEKGYRLNVQTLEATRRFADLVAHLDVEPEPQFVERLMLPFEYTRVPGVKTADRGWTTDPPGRNSISLWWLTAIALAALESVIRMLDAVINRHVLQHFHVRKPSSLKLDLDELFYPDFGFAAFSKLKGEATNNIAVKLQQLRAHAGIGPVEKDRLFSLIIYGPPGTGKSTLVEAVAKSAGVPLVEITPSRLLKNSAAFANEG